MHKILFFILFLFCNGACAQQAPFDVVGKKTITAFDSVAITFRDVLSIVEDSALLFTYSVDKRGNVLDSAMTMLVKGAAGCKYKYLPNYDNELIIHIQLRSNEQILQSFNYSSFKKIDTVETTFRPLVLNPLQIPFGFYPETGKLLNGFTQYVNMIPNIPIKDSLGIVSLFDKADNMLGRFMFKEQQALQLTMPDTGSVKCVFNDSLTMFIQGSRKGYALLNKTFKDSVLITVYRGLDEPPEEFEILLETDSGVYILLKPPVEPELFVINTCIHKETLNGKPYAISIRSVNGQILSKHYYPNTSDKKMYTPLILVNNDSIILSDASYARYYAFDSRVKRPIINYQIINQRDQLVDFGTVDWINDSLFVVKKLQLFGNGIVEFIIDKKELYGNEFTIVAITKPNYGFISDFYTSREKQMPSFFKEKEDGKKDTLTRFQFTLENVTVKAQIKKRIDELEDKYVSSIMFKQIFERRINVIDDEQARNGMNIFDYISMRYPKLTVRSKVIKSGPLERTIRTIEADYYVDEAFSDEQLVANIPVSDIAYIKIFNNPIRGLGGKGAIAIYTRKGNETSISPLVKYRLPLDGIQF